MITDFTLKSHYSECEDKVNWYAPPEPVISHQGDVYALGVILYQLIAHQLPARDKKTGQLILDGMKGKAPLAVQKIIRKMLEKSRRLRYRSFDSVISNIKRVEKELAMLARKKAEDKMRAGKMRKRFNTLRSLGIGVLITSCVLYLLWMLFPKQVKTFIDYLQAFF